MKNINLIQQMSVIILKYLEEKVSISFRSSYVSPFYAQSMYMIFDLLLTI